MKTYLIKLICCACLLAAIITNTGCGPDFYLSESEAAAYSASFSSEEGANRLFMPSIQNEVLTIRFDNTTSPPRIQSTNLTSLMRGYTTYGLVEGINHQIDLDRLNGEMEKQVEGWIQKELKLYSGNNDAGVQLSRLDSIGVQFLEKPTFVFHPDRQSIGFRLKVKLFINGTIKVDALDWFTNWLAGGINGTYPLNVDVNDLDLTGEAVLSTPFADAGDITLNITSRPGSVAVYDAQTATEPSPSEVRDGVRDVVRSQLSQPLKESFTQRYNNFALTGLRLTQPTAQVPSSFQHIYTARPETAKPMSHVVVRAADGKLYHIRKTEGGRSVIATVRPFPTLDSRIENEPALIASATDQLEVAATTVNGALVYSHWRDDMWGNQTTVAPGTAGYYKGKPAIVASAPGQVEIIAATQSGNLYHVRRRNGQWLPATVVPMSKGSMPTKPLRDPVAVQTGNKIVVITVDGINRPHAIAFDLESNSWGLPFQISNLQYTRFAPAAAVSGNGRIEVVYAGLNGTPFHRTLVVQSAIFNTPMPVTGITFSGNETAIGGGMLLNASPTLVCSGLGQMELVGRRADNHLYHTRFLGPTSPLGTIDGRTISQGWQGWTDLNGNFSGSLTFDQMTGFSAAVTRAGKLAVASIPAPSALLPGAEQFVYQNSYDVERFGTQPWKTVLWRGYEQSGSRKFIGQPALAVTDRNAAITSVVNNRELRAGRLAESNSASMPALVLPYINSISAAVAPVIVSTMPGQLEIIAVGLDGRLRHIRRPDRGAAITTSLAAPSGVTFQKQPTVIGYGSGQLEVVAVSQTGSLYHWRYQNGVWSTPVQVTGYVISQPVLVNFGSGQLMLLALGSDRKLYFWSFTGGAWSGFRPAPTNLVVDERFFNSLSASSWGDGTVDLGLVQYQTGALYHGRLFAYLSYATPIVFEGPFSSVGGVLTDTPILTAFSPTRLNVLAVGTNRTIYSAWTSRVTGSQLNPMGILWSGYSSVGGTGLRLGGVAKLGANELTAVGVDPSGKLMRSRYNGSAWMQFEPVLGSSSTSVLSRPATTSLSN